MAISNFYLDESGNSGDLIKYNIDLTFGGQPMFALAAIGIDCDSEISLFVSELVKKYKYQASDIKSKNIYKPKPRFILELCNFIVDKELPFFIELVDKQYHISSTIVNHYVIPGGCLGDESDGRAQNLRNLIADHIRLKSPISCYQKLSDLCQTQTEENLILLFEELIHFFNADSKFSECQQFVEETLDDYQQMKKEVDKDALSRFIPIPDIGKRNQDIFLLSHVSSVAGILGRINFYRKGSMSEVTLIHDEQSHFDEILHSINNALPQMKFDGVPPTPCADYNLQYSPNLKFEKSEMSIGIQVADILAGYMSRYVNDFMYENKKMDSVYHDIFGILSHAFNHCTSVGVNMVVPSAIRSDIDRFHYLRESQIRLKGYR